MNKKKKIFGESGGGIWAAGRNPIAEREINVRARWSQRGKTFCSKHQKRRKGGKVRGGGISRVGDKLEAGGSDGKGVKKNKKFLREKKDFKGNEGVAVHLGRGGKGGI